MSRVCVSSTVYCLCGEAEGIDPAGGLFEACVYGVRLLVTEPWCQGVSCSVTVSAYSHFPLHMCHSSIRIPSCPCPCLTYRHCY